MLNIELSPYLDMRLQQAIKLMGYEKLHEEQEKSIIQNIRNKNVLTILATGSGKTACYVIPGLVRSRMTIVVSPLKALQLDQVNALKKIGISAFLLNSDIGETERSQTAALILQIREAKASCFLYVAPETLLTEAFFNLFGENCFNSMVIDEVHCVSTWGSSFRPDYMRLGAAAKRLGIEHCVGYTATVTPDIISDIFRYTPLKKKNCEIIEGNPIRANITLKTIYTDTFLGSVKEVADKKKSELLRLTKMQKTGAIIVYCTSRAACENLYNHKILQGQLKRQGYSVYMFHAGMDTEEKMKAFSGFTHDPKPIVFATNAFGMGIDREDVRQVIHYNNPNSLLNYAQEYGRSGRDGQEAVCTTFFDRSKIEGKIGQSAVYVPDIITVEKSYASITQTYSKMSTDAQTKFSTSKFTRKMEQVLAKNEDWSDVERGIYLDRLKTSIAFLKRAVIIREDAGEPIKLMRLTPGTKKHLLLIEMTHMQKRSEETQLRLVEKFFKGVEQTQEHVWKLMKS